MKVPARAFGPVAQPGIPKVWGIEHLAFNQVVASSNLVRPIHLKGETKNMKTKLEINKHVLVPEHKKLNDKEKAALLEKYYISPNNLPRILSKDKAISDLKVTKGDIIKVTRQSATAGVTKFYRVVINE